MAVEDLISHCMCIDLWEPFVGFLDKKILLSVPLSQKKTKQKTKPSYLTGKSFLFCILRMAIIFSSEIIDPRFLLLLLIDRILQCVFYFFTLLFSLNYNTGIKFDYVTWLVGLIASEINTRYIHISLCLLYIVFVKLFFLQ